MKVSSNILLLVASVTTNFLVPANATLRNVDLQNNQVAANEEELSNRMLGRKGKGGNKKKNTKKGIGGAGPWVKNDSSSPDTMDLAAALSKIAELEAKLNECETGDDGDEGRGEIPDEPGFVEEGGECNKAAECIQREGGFGVVCLVNTRGYCYPSETFIEIGSVNCSESNACGDTVLPACSDGERCIRKPNVEDCIQQPTAGTCTCTKGCSTRLLEVQTRRLGKGLGTKRDWSVEIDEEDTPH